MSLTVTVRDNETGDTETAKVSDGDYLLICAEPCRLHFTQAFPKSGTHQLTIKGVHPVLSNSTPTGEPETA